MIALLPLLCGAFIAPTDGLRYNDALQFVVVRDGTHTTMSVQNTYRGPLDTFALLVPVPVVLHEDDVKTLDPHVFDAFQAVTGPRVQKLAEMDPCEAPDERDGVAGGAAPGGPPGVTVEAQFAVGEYDVAVLGASESSALDKWLGDNGYKIPPAVATQLRPYIEAGDKFFVAKVDPKRIKLEHGVATLSPLRFSYDAPELSLPVRLSAATSAGVQDVIVYALADNQQFTAANRPTTHAPSDVDITPAAAAQFPAFYEALIARAFERQPDVALVEFVGSTMGLESALQAVGVPAGNRGFGVTRLHFRVHKDGKLDDVVLTAAPMAEWFHATFNRKEPWTGAVACSKPARGRYVADRSPAPAPDANGPPLASLDTLVESDIPALGIKAAAKPVAAEPAKKSGCGCAPSHYGDDPPSGILLALAIGTLLGRRGCRAPRGQRRSAGPCRSPRSCRP